MILASTAGDTAVTEWFVDRRTGVADTIAVLITTLGNTAVLGVVTLLAVVWFLSSRRRDAAMFVGVATVLGYLAMVGLKHLFARERPPESQRLLEISSYSFPSGHAMMSMIVYGLVAIAVSRVAGASWTRLLPVAAVLLSALIGLTRVYLGVHWLSDVIVGWLVGLVWLVAATAVWRLLASATVGSAVRVEPPRREPSRD